MRFESKVAVIVGGANGIGRAAAEIMVGEGGVVAAVDVSQRALDELAAQVSGASGEMVPFVCDATVVDEVLHCIEFLERQLGRFDILVNAVGGSTAISKQDATIDEMTLEEWRAVLEFNLTPTFNFCSGVAPSMRKHGSGKIVNVSSIAARGDHDGTSSAYALAKAGVSAFTRKLARELGPNNITVNAVAPGLTLTTRGLSLWNRLSLEEQEEAIARVPLKRLAEPQDPARVIAFLASTDADYVSGVTIEVTGGQ